MAELAVSAEEALALTEKRSSPARREAVRLLAAEGRMSAADVCYFTGISMASLRGLEKVGIVAFSEEEELRLPDLSDAEPAGPIVLNEEQEAAYRSILALTETGKPEAVLLQGVTGSGKTEVYLRLVRDILDRGRRAIVLVPEIVLTPQMMRRFAACFGEGVAMLHSALRMTERYDQWKRIRRGEVQVVLGTRSAIFAPLKDVGLIVLDEEQESSYQSENPPPVSHPGRGEISLRPGWGPSWSWGPPPHRWRPPGTRSRGTITGRCCGGATTGRACRR